MAALHPSPKSVSWLGLIADWWRQRTMSDWLKIGLTVAGFAVVTWASVQQHEYRLVQLEHAFDEHLKNHDVQFKEISKTLHDIDITLTRMNAQKGN